MLTASSSLKAQALAAVGRLNDGQAALAQGDFDGSQTAFSDARALVEQTQNQLDEALSVSRKILSFVDVTGTVRSNQNLLEIASHLAVAGSNVATATQLLSQTGSLVDAITQAKPSLAAASQELEEVEKLLANTNPDSVPSEARESVVQLQQIVPAINELLSYTTAQSDVLLSLLGADRDREYLLLLANNHELRPNGGFIGTIALLNIDRGQVESVDVSSVYDGDGQLKQAIAPPSPLLSIVNRWYLRDTNWFLDFSVSARKAAEFFEKEGGPTVNGVILMTPDVIERMLQVTGPIEVPGYDQTITAENFAEITQQEVTYEYDKSVNKPKQFLADVTPLLLDKILQQPEHKLPTLQALGAALSHKEMLMYFRDEEAQRQLEDLNWAGKIPNAPTGILHVNNANIGGHKSDQFIEQEIDQQVQVLADGSAQVSLIIRRTHKGPFEVGERKFPAGENPSQKNNVVWQRVLAPLGSQLLEAKGFAAASDIPRYVVPESDVALTGDSDVALWQAGQVTDNSGTVIGQEAGHMFFGNWIVTEPGQTSVSVYRYTIPTFVTMPSLFDRVSSGAVQFVKQSGADRTSVRVEINLPQGYAIVSTIPETGITRESATKIVYRGEGETDRAVGFVFEKD